jgi:hypothetical protein
MSAITRLVGAIPELPGASCVHVTDFTELDPDLCLTVCAHCPALDACRAWTLTLPRAHRPRDMVQGGIHWDSRGLRVRPAPTPRPLPATCSHGHEFPTDCPTCAAARAASRKAPRKNGSRHSSRSTDGHCVRGHDFDGGGRCPQCNREDARASYDRLKARALANGRTTNHQRAIEREERRHAKEAA